MFDLDYYVFKRYKEVSIDHDELKKSLLLHKKYSSKYLITYYKMCNFIIDKFNKNIENEIENEIEKKLYAISIDNNILLHSYKILDSSQDIFSIYNNLVYTENLSKYYKNLYNTRDKDLCGELLYHTWASIFNNYYHIFIQKIEETYYIN